MPSTHPPSFGKRNLQPERPIVPLAMHSVRASSPLAAYESSTAEPDAMVVCDTRLAAGLAALVVGCVLAGLDIAGVGPFLPLWEGLAKDPRAAAVLPAMVLFGLIGGGRAAATTLLIGHVALKWLGQTSHAAYAVGGIGSAAVFWVIMHHLGGSLPTHGWLIDTLAGGASGYLYRTFAGLRPA